MKKHLEDLLNNFNTITVMDVCIYTYIDSQTKTPIAFNPTKTYRPENFIHKCYLDTLKITNIKQNKPHKSFNIGLYNMPLIQTNPSYSIEIKDALGKKEILEEFFGAQWNSDKSSLLFKNKNINKCYALEGITKIVNSDSTVDDFYIFIPCFMPTGLFNLNMSIDGDVGVFDLSGNIYMAKTQSNHSINAINNFIEISEQSFFKEKLYYITYNLNKTQITNNNQIYNINVILSNNNIQNYINASIEQPIVLQKPQLKPGHAWNGWLYLSSNQRYDLLSGGKITTNQDWDLIPSVQVNTYYIERFIEQQVFDKQRIKYNIYTSHQTLNDPVKEYQKDSSLYNFEPEDKKGYKFTGWKDRFNQDIINYIPFIPSQDRRTVQVDAVYIPILYIITYELNGGYFDKDYIPPQTYDIENMPVIQNPIKQYSKFDCWADNEGNRITFTTGTTYGDKTLYAQWEYNITLDPNGGNIETKQIYLEVGDQYTLPIATHPNFTSYVWYDENGLVIPESGTWLENYGKKLTAIWYK